VTTKKIDARDLAVVRATALI